MESAHEIASAPRGLRGADSVLLQAQTGTGELRGVLSSGRGRLAGLEVRIKNTARGEVTTTITSSSGEYS